MPDDKKVVSQDEIDKLLAELTAEPAAPAPAGEAKKRAMDQVASDAPVGAPRSLEFVLDIPLEFTVEVGRTRLTIGELLHLGPGSIVELSKPAGEPLEVFVNGKLVARGEVVIVNEKYGIRLTDVISKTDRTESLK